MSVAFVLTISTFPLCLLDFKNRSMRARFGEHTFPPEKFPVAFEVPVIGVMVAGATIGFILTSLVVMVIVIFLVWPPVWQMVWSLRIWLLNFLGPHGGPDRAQARAPEGGLHAGRELRDEPDPLRGLRLSVWLPY